MARRPAMLPAATLCLAILAGGCGSEGIELDADATAQERRGAELFAQRCAGCHTLSAAGAEGSAVSPDRVERTDGPNLDQRQETVEGVLFAIRNGGFSGAIMPQNLIVGEDALAVAEFVAEYAGRDIERPATPEEGQLQGG